MTQLPTTHFNTDKGGMYDETCYQMSTMDDDWVCNSLSTRLLWDDAPPEITLVEQLWETGFHNAESERILQSATFFNDPQAVQHLLDHLRLLEKSDVRQQHKRLMYRVVMERMTCHPEQLIIERLNTETNPWEKAKFIDLLRDFYTEEVFLALIDQLDDLRNIGCASCGQRRVCDIAYQDLIFKLEILGFVKYRDFEGIYGKEQDHQATLITTFKEYWEANKAFILQELPKREVPEHLKRLYAPPQPTATPTAASR